MGGGRSKKSEPGAVSAESIDKGEMKGSNCSWITYRWAEVTWMFTHDFALAHGIVASKFIVAEPP